MTPDAAGQNDPPDTPEPTPPTCTREDCILRPDAVCYLPERRCGRQQLNTEEDH